MYWKKYRKQQDSKEVQKGLFGGAIVLVLKVKAKHDTESTGIGIKSTTGRVRIAKEQFPNTIINWGSQSTAEALILCSECAIVLGITLGQLLDLYIFGKSVIVRLATWQIADSLEESSGSKLEQQQRHLEGSFECQREKVICHQLWY